MQKKLKMYTNDGKWVIVDGDRVVEFDTAYDAWQLVLLLREIRPRVPYIKPLYPVKSLNPFPERRTKNVRLYT